MDLSWENCRAEATPVAAFMTLNIASGSKRLIIGFRPFLSFSVAASHKRALYKRNFGNNTLTGAFTERMAGS
jgi:hypothetical protein